MSQDVLPKRRARLTRSIRTPICYPHPRKELIDIPDEKGQSGWKGRALIMALRGRGVGGREQVFVDPSADVGLSYLKNILSRIVLL